MTTKNNKTHNSFDLRTTWIVDGPRDAVWARLADVESWPTWWRHVKEVVHVASTPAQGVGSTYDVVWSSRLPYKIRLRVTTTGIEKEQRIQCQAQGDLSGTGVWALSDSLAGTVVTYDWRVELKSPCMKFMSRILAPVFRWNHQRVMEDGGKALENLLRHADPAR